MLKKIKEKKESVLITTGIVLIIILSIIVKVLNIYAKNNIFGLIVFSPVVLIIIGLFEYSQKIKKENPRLNFILKFICSIFLTAFSVAVLIVII